ncbi:MAG: hypothetical protein U9Q17_00365 [Chloroflexota bacterium]|nr:hypothetical protein [Chloroflexota bacterium]
MDLSSWLFPLLIAVAIAATALYFRGRRKNLILMKEYARAIERVLKPVDQTYTWVGGYIGFKADYKVKQALVKTVKVTLHLMPRLSMFYYPIAKLTMKHDKLYVVMEASKDIEGEGHLIRKGYYRVIPPGIKDIEKFHKRDVKLGDREFEMLYQGRKREELLLSWAQGLKIDFNKVKHLSFTSSTNVVYALVEPTQELIPALLAAMPDLAAAVVK